MLFSQNVFKIGPESLALLAPAAYSKILSLEVRLTACSCVEGHCCAGLASFQDFYKCSACHPCYKRGPDNPFTLHSDIGRRLLNDWQTFCDALRLQCTRGLRLTIICDCGDAKSALQVVKPLQSMPAIAHCSIRLGQSPDNQLLGQLAEKVARQLTRKGINSFPFQELPGELQEMVIGQTDIISPTELSLNAPHTKAFQQEWPLQRGLRQPSDGLCCFKCSDTCEVCVCPVRHAAYTSSPCDCWRFPSSIFLASKKLNSIANKLFFSRNKFHFWDTCRDKSPADRIPGPEYKYLVKTTELLQRLPSRMLMHLRWIDLDFRSFQKSDALVGTAGYESWKKLTALIKQKIQTSQLTIELQLKPEHPDFLPCLNDLQDLQDTWQTHQNIADLFQLSDGRSYKDFFVHLTSPMWYSLEDDTTRWKRERVLEKRVMGEDYDTAGKGKYRNCHFKEESGPRKYWFDHFGLMQRHESVLDLDDLTVQAQLLSGALNENDDFGLAAGGLSSDDLS